MVSCHACGTPIEHHGVIGRRDECACGADLHCCAQCRHFEPSAPHECKEPDADAPHEKDRANFCDYFQIGEGARSERDAAAQARSRLDALFKRK